MPWDDLKVAFGIGENVDRLWRAHDAGKMAFPDGWEMSETDSSGARTVAVFRVSVMPTEADAFKVKAQLRRFDR